MGADHQRLIDEVRSLKSRLAEKEGEMEEALAKLRDDKDGAFESEKMRLEEEVRLSRLAHENLKEELSLSTKDLEAMGKEKRDAEERNEEIRGEEDERKRLVDALKVENEEMRTENEEMRTENEEIRKVNEEIR